jgi:hypothetical protein
MLVLVLNDVTANSLQELIPHIHPSMVYHQLDHTTGLDYRVANNRMERRSQGYFFACLQGDVDLVKSPAIEEPSPGSFCPYVGSITGSCIQLVNPHQGILFHVPPESDIKLLQWLIERIDCPFCFLLPLLPDQVGENLVRTGY